MGLTNVELLQGIFPEETAARVADRGFRLVHVDVDVYQSAKDVFDWAWPRLSAGRGRRVRRLRFPGDARE